MSTQLNTPVWNPSLKTYPRAFQEVWHLKFNDPETQRGLWLRFTLLSSANGFKQVAETWAILFQRNSNREVRKLAFKQSFGIQSFKTLENRGIQIENCTFQDNKTWGKIQSRGNSIQWDLTIIQGGPSHFLMTPKGLKKAKLLRNTVTTVYEDLLFSGTVQINDQETLHWNNAPGMQGHVYGPKNDHSWVWGHCNTFVDEKGNPAHFLFEGLTSRPQIGPLIGPPLSSFFFYYQGQAYSFNRLRDVIHLKSKNTLTEWLFQAERDEISFRGFIKAEHKDFVGLTFEDTNGSLLYCTHSNLSDMKILVYRKGKLETTLVSKGTTTLELVSRNRNPYVPLSI